MSRRIRVIRQAAKTPVIQVQVHGTVDPSVIYDIGRKIRHVLPGRQIIVTDERVTVSGVA